MGNTLCCATEDTNTGLIDTIGGPQSQERNQRQLQEVGIGNAFSRMPIYVSDKKMKRYIDIIKYGPTIE